MSGRFRLLLEWYETNGAQSKCSLFDLQHYQIQSKVSSLRLIEESGIILVSVITPSSPNSKCYSYNIKYKRHKASF